MKPRAFLSYRHDFEPEKAALEILKEITAEKGELELIYDKSVTEVGNCVVAFMDELIAARCVFIFISMDYFKSPYTLFELISISERAVSGKILLPICLPEQVLNVRDFTDIKDFWDASDSTRVCTKQLLVFSGEAEPEDDEIWRRIESAWEKLVFPYLNTVRDMQLDINDSITNAVEESSKQARIEIQKITQNHQLLLINELKAVFGQDRELRDDLCEEYDISITDQSADVLATRLINNNGEVRSPLAALTRVAESLKGGLSGDRKQWVRCFKRIKRISGCLLLNTIDPVWWFNNELEARFQKEKGVTTTGYNLDEGAFIEVIFSTELLATAVVKAPEYKLSGMNKAIPGTGSASSDYDHFLFDATSKKALTSALLGEVYMDLCHSEHAPEDERELIKNIKGRAESITMERKGVPVYYLVKQSYLEQLKAQEWFTFFEQEL